MAALISCLARTARRRRLRFILVAISLVLLLKLSHARRRRRLAIYLQTISSSSSTMRAASGLARRAAAAVGIARSGRAGGLGIARIDSESRLLGAPRRRDPGTLVLQVALSSLVVRNLQPPALPLLRLARSFATTLGLASEPPPPFVEVRWGRGERARTFRAHPAAPAALAHAPVEGCGDVIGFEGVFRFEDSVSLAALEQERLRIVCYCGGAEAGRLSLPLEAVVCGPALNDHRLLSPFGEPSGGRIAFQCRVSEQREWRLSFSVLSLRLLSDAHEALALDSGGGPVLFSLSYTFTSGSTSGTSIESSWHSPTTRLKMPRRDGTELLWRAQPPTADADGPDELPAIEHHGAFWELRHGALRIELTWHRADHVKAQGRRARASSRRAGAEGGPDDARWHQSQRYSSSPPERRGSPPLGRSLPASALSSDSAAARALPPPPTRSNSSSAAANVGPDGWRAEPPPSPAPPASPPPPHSSPSRPAGAVSPPSVSDRVGEAAGEGDLARRSHREDGRTAKAWVVMEKAFAQLPESSDLRRRRRAHRLVRVPSDEGVAEASCSSAPEVSASAASRGDARGSTRGGAAGDAVGGAGGGARRGGERRITRSVTGEPVGLSFCEDLYLNGKVVGVCEGQMQLLEQPSVVQQAYGTLTEAGTQFAAPVVLGSSAGRRRRVGVAGSLLEARRLAALCDGLSRALARDDVLVRERVVAELSDLLAVSHKRGGHASFVFDSSADLAACRETMFDLWELLLRSLEAGALRFDARTQAYDLLVQLLRRAEISTTMQDEGGRAGGRLSSRRGAAVPTHQLLLWLELSQRTLSHVLVAFDDLASVEHSDHLLGVCARLMAMSYFRLPAFASALIETLHAEDVLAASQPAAIPEFRGIAFSLDCAGELAALQERGFSTHPPLDWRHIHRSAEAAAAHALARGGMPRPTGEAPWAFGARTKYRAPSQRDAALAAQAAAQRGAASHLAGVLRLPAWRERLGRRGHLFCLFFTEWLDVVIDSLGPTVPPHFFAWPRLPGFTTLLTCTLLEMSARPPPLLAEPLVQLSNQLLRCTHLHSVLVKIVFHRCSVHDVRAVSTTLNLMNSWMTALLHRLQEDRMRPADAAPLSQPLLRSTFDFAFFFRGMAVLFDSEHVQVLLKACEFLYRHFDLLPDHQADKMRTTMLRGCLTRLQLHWSAEVRSFFAHLLVLRLEQPCAWAVPRLPSEPAPAPVEPAIVRQFEAAAARLASLAVQALPAERAQERREQRGRPEQPDEGRQLQQLQPYAAAALALYEQLTAVRRDMQRDLSLWSRGASSAAPPSLPTLKCDTSVLDLEEDRVIWVRESELGKGIVFD